MSPNALQIGKTSGLVMTLTGILKNILLVIASVMIWHTSITWLQSLGYAVALFGLLYYSIGWEQIMSFSVATWAYVKSVWSSPSLEENRLSPAVRRALIMGITLFVVALLTVGLMYDSDETTSRKAARTS